MAYAQKWPQARPETVDPRRNPKPTLVRREPQQPHGGDEEAMTARQASYLKTLAEEAKEPEAFEASLSRREASKRILELKDKLGLLDPPPHTD